jgi:hypothetical protein
MSEPQRHETEEKPRERQEKGEKHGEKEEKNWEEKWRRDPLGGMAWAGILIWAGLVLLADNLKLFARFERLEAWAIILIGAGLMDLLSWNVIGPLILILFGVFILLRVLIGRR